MECCADNVTNTVAGYDGVRSEPPKFFQSEKAIAPSDASEIYCNPRDHSDPRHRGQE